MTKQRLFRFASKMFGLVVVFLCSMLTINSCYLDAPTVGEAKTNAGPIINALGRYQENRSGWYPEHLGLLTPEYLPTIPKPAGRYNFGYFRCNEGKGYELLYRSIGGDLCGYNSVINEWGCDDSSLPHYDNEQGCLYEYHDGILWSDWAREDMQPDTFDFDIWNIYMSE